MFSSIIFSLDEWLAPRPLPEVEFESFLKSGQISQASELLKRNKDVAINANDGLGLAPMHYACVHGNMDLCMELLLRGADVSKKSDTCGSTPLHFAAANNHHGIVEILLRSGADPSIPNNNGTIPVELCSEASVKEVLLKRRGDDLLFGPSDTTPASERTVRIQTPENVVERIEQTDRSPPKVLHESVPYEHSSKMDAVLKGVQEAAIATAEAFRYGPSDTDNMRSIFKACQQVSNQNLLVDVVRLCNLDSKYVNVRAASMQLLAVDGMTPLHAAAHWGNVPMMKFLLEGVSISQEQYYSVKPSATSTRGTDRGAMSPKELYTATRSRNTKAISGLLKGFSFQSDSVAETKSVAAAPGSSTSIDDLDVFADSDSSSVKNKGEEIESDAPRVLISADPWGVDLQGKTPLHHAVAKRNLEACRVLRDAMRQRGPKKTGLQLETGHLKKATNVSISGTPNLKGGRPEADTVDCGVDPVGPNAPVDLTGSTPLGLISGKGYTQIFRAGDNNDSSCVEDEFFSPGDASVLPRTPHLHRSGAVSTTKKNKRNRLYHENIHSDISQSARSIKEVTPSDDFLSSPVVVNKSISDRGNCDARKDGTTKKSLVYAYSEAGGWRSHMEDRVVICAPLIPEERIGVSSEAQQSRDYLIPELDMTLWSVYAVLDGHGGEFASAFVSEILPGILIRNAFEMIKEGTTNGVITLKNFSTIAEKFFSDLWSKTLMQADELLSKQGRMGVTANAKGMLSLLDKSGTTCVACLVTPSYIAVANVGDSRAVLGCRNPEGGIGGVYPIAMSEDHKPNLEGERARIEKAGCSVSRISPESSGFEIRTPFSKEILRMSRSLGDFYLKNCRNNESEKLGPNEQAVLATPDVSVRRRNDNDFCLLLACDGIWDVFENDAAILFIDEHAQRIATSTNSLAVSEDSNLKSSVAEICDELLLACLRRGSRDNMTAVLLMFYAEDFDQGKLAATEVSFPDVEATDIVLSPVASTADMSVALHQVDDDSMNINPEDIEQDSTTRRKLFEKI